MTANYEELRDEITRSGVGQVGWRCPRSLRERVVAFTQERLREGVPAMKIAKALGIGNSSLSRWLPPRKPRRLRPVRVLSEPRSEDSLVLLTPDGYRLEGLSVSTAADVLRRLGC